METVILDPENQDPASPGNVEKAFTPSALEYDPTIPARYMARKIDSTYRWCILQKLRWVPKFFFNFLPQNDRLLS